MVKASPPHARGEGLIPGQGDKIPHTSQANNQNINNRSKIVKKINKDFKNAPHQKNKKPLWTLHHIQVQRDLAIIRNQNQNSY